jgi:hypothetical protein
MALRQQVWVDRSVQGVLTGRVVLYWLAGVLYVFVGIACFQYHQNPSWSIKEHATELFRQLWPWIPTTVLLLPLAIYDVVRLSNLFVGPIYRLRLHFEALRNDIACPPLGFREDDYWRDLTAPINDLQAEILRLNMLVVDLQQSNARLMNENSAMTTTSQNTILDDESEPTSLQKDEVSVNLVGELPSVPSPPMEAPPFEIPESLTSI